MFSLLLHPTPDQEDYLVGELWESATTGILEDAGGIRAFFDSSADPRALLQRFAAYHPEFRQEKHIDWAQVSRDAWPPMRIGSRFYLVAPWHANQVPPDGRLRLEINPGMACGTGRHPATQLCLEALEKYVRPGHTVLDVGTGSGILARAAVLLGAGRVAGCDLDSDSLPLFVGSANAVRSAWADVIVANIDSATIENLASELSRVRKPGSTLILSGFEDGDAPQGFASREILRRDNWLCLIC